MRSAEKHVNASRPVSFPSFSNNFNDKQHDQMYSSRHHTHMYIQPAISYQHHSSQPVRWSPRGDIKNDGGFPL